MTLRIRSAYLSIHLFFLLPLPLFRNESKRFLSIESSGNVNEGEGEGKIGPNRRSLDENVSIKSIIDSFARNKAISAAKVSHGESWATSFSRKWRRRRRRRVHKTRTLEKYFQRERGGGGREESLN